MAPPKPRVLIVAAGPSVEGVDLSMVPPRVTVIAVNGAIRFTPKVDVWFTLDPSTPNRALLRERRPGVRYVMAVPDDYGSPGAAVQAHRAPRDPGVTYLRRVSGDGPWSARPGLVEDRGAIHTGNSAWGALGYAYHLRPGKIGLLGVDGTSGGYAYLSGAPRPQFDHLPDLFASALPQLQAAGVSVRNGSPESRVVCFPRVTPSALLRWLLR